MSKIFVCDDDVVMLMMVKRILGSKHEIETCQNINALVSLLKEKTPDIVLLDFQMPEGDALSALQVLRDNDLYPRIPVAILSGELDLRLKQQCLDEGVMDFIKKPFMPDALTARVDGLLEQL